MNARLHRMIVRAAAAEARAAAWQARWDAEMEKQAAHEKRRQANRSSTILTAALRQAIRDGGQSYGLIARATGLPKGGVWKFASGKSIHLATADKLAKHFNLKISTGQVTASDTPAKTRTGKVGDAGRRRVPGVIASVGDADPLRPCEIVPTATAWPVTAGQSPPLCKHRREPRGCRRRVLRSGAGRIAANAANGQF